MGAVKEEMEKTETDDLTLTDKVKGALKGLRAKGKDGDPQATAKTFADHITAAETKLTDLLATKRADLKREAGDETYNRKALALLEVMDYHISEICNLAEQYGALRKQ
jgi:hypothetical protein